MRRAAAQARAWLQARAALHLGVEAGGLEAGDGIFHVPGTQASIGYGALVSGEHVELPLADDIPTKPVESYRIVGRAAGRVDIPGKVRGALTFVHDVRVPGMLHGRVVRPPYAGRDSGDFVGSSLLEVDRDSVRDIPGLVDVVVQGDFVGVIAEREEYAVQAARRLRVRWKPVPPLPALDDPEPALRANPPRRASCCLTGELPANGAGTVLQRARLAVPDACSIGPSCAVADWHDDGLTVWSGTQNPHVLRIDLAKLCGLGEDRIEIVRMEAAGCYGRNCATMYAPTRHCCARGRAARARAALARTGTPVGAQGRGPADGRQRNAGPGRRAARL